MKVSDGKIVEITERELYKRWVEWDFDMMMPFEEFRCRFEEIACVVKGEGDA